VDEFSEDGDRRDARPTFKPARTECNALPIYFAEIRAIRMSKKIFPFHEPFFREISLMSVKPEQNNVINPDLAATGMTSKRHLEQP